MDIKNEKYKENLRKLRSELPRGYTKILAREFGISQMSITNALWGRTQRLDIVERAIEIAEENRKITNKLNEVVNGKKSKIYVV